MWISGTWTWTTLGQQRMDDQNERAIHTEIASEAEAQAFLARAAASRRWRPLQPALGRKLDGGRAGGRPGETPRVLGPRERRLKS